MGSSDLYYIHCALQSAGIFNKSVWSYHHLELYSFYMHRNYNNYLFKETNKNLNEKKILYRYNNTKLISFF